MTEIDIIYQKIELKATYYKYQELPNQLKNIIIILEKY